VRGGPFRCREARPLTISHSLLSDLVNAGEGAAALLQVGVARVDVGALGERGVVVPHPDQVLSLSKARQFRRTASARAALSG
jgi:hypothetical protein